MELRKLRTEDDAVSPVIGVILMVAITVILAAVIGTFVLGIGSQQQDIPKASFDFVLDKSTNSLTITHDGGDVLDDENTAEVLIKGPISGGPAQWNLPIDSGDQRTVGVSGDGTAKIFWQSASGGKTSILAEFDVNLSPSDRATAFRSSVALPSERERYQRQVYHRPGALTRTMDAEAGAVAGAVLVVVGTIILSGPAVGVVDLTREPDVFELNPGSGTVSLSVVDADDRAVIESGQFASGAHYITPPGVTVDIQSVTEQPILTYRIQIPDLNYTDIQVTFLGPKNQGQMTLKPDRDAITLPEDPADTYRGELTVVVRDSSGKRVVHQEAITVEVRR